MLRRGDTVVSTGGDDGMQGRRGVVEAELGDGAYLVKWSGMGSSSEARRAEGRFLSRHSSQSTSIRMLNVYLLQVRRECCIDSSVFYFCYLFFVL